MIKLYYLFLINPKKNYSLVQGQNPAKAFLVVLALTYIQVFFISLIPFSQSVTISQNSLNIPINPWFLILIPLYEESIFRLPLKISTMHVYISLSLLISSIVVITLKTGFGENISLFNYYLIAFALALPFFFILRMLKSKKLELVLLKNYTPFFYMSILIFTMVHFLYVPISIHAILTYLVYGYSLSFLRISGNFLCALIMHLILIVPFFLSAFV